MHHNAELHLNKNFLHSHVVSMYTYRILLYDRNKNYVDYSALEIHKSDQQCDTRKTDRSFARREKITREKTEAEGEIQKKAGKKNE